MMEWAILGRLSNLLVYGDLSPSRRVLMKVSSPSYPFAKNISTCRMRAEQCRLGAQSSNVPEEIDTLVNFAANWDGLADAFELESTRNEPYGIG
jgi:hypothetical protein